MPTKHNIVLKSQTLSQHLEIIKHMLNKTLYIENRFRRTNCGLDNYTVVSCILQPLNNNLYHSNHPVCCPLPQKLVLTNLMPISTCYTISETRSESKLVCAPEIIIIHKLQLRVGWCWGVNLTLFEKKTQIESIN